MKIDPNELSKAHAYHLMISCVVPRPIALISTLSSEGVGNAAPFSFYNGINSQPPLLTVAIGMKGAVRKDTLKNIEENSEFVINVVTESILQQTVQSAANYPAEMDEMHMVGFETLPSDKIKARRIAASPVHMECVLRQSIRFGDCSTVLVIGEVLCYHIDDSVLDEDAASPVVAAHRLQAVSRHGGNWYGKAETLFELYPDPIK